MRGVATGVGQQPLPLAPGQALQPSFLTLMEALQLALPWYASLMPAKLRSPPLLSAPPPSSDRLQVNRLVLEVAGEQLNSALNNPFFGVL